MKAFNKKNCLIVCLGLLVLLGIGSLYDYSISQALFNPESTFGVFFASYGQLPAMLGIGIGGVLLLRTAGSKKLLGKILSYIFGVLLTVFAIFGVAMDPTLYMKNMSMAVSAVIAIVLVAIVDLIILKLVKDTSDSKLNKAIIVILVTVFAEIILINMVKVPWSRPRMRMLAVESEAVFQPWWQIGCELKEHLISIGVAAEEFKSFPSGHAGNAACLMLLGILPSLCPKFEGKENLFFYIGLAFTVIVAISRIIMGAHFLSDVVMGTLVTFVIEIIMVHLVLKRE